MGNVLFDAIVCAAIIVGTVVVMRDIGRNADAIDDILVAMLNAKGE